jgi:hypothetical protein
MNTNDHGAYRRKKTQEALEVIFDKIDLNIDRFDWSIYSFILKLNRQYKLSLVRRTSNINIYLKVSRQIS